MNEDENLSKEGAILSQSSSIPLCSARIHMNARNERHHGASIGILIILQLYSIYNFIVVRFFRHVSIGNEHISVSRTYKRQMM